MSKIRSGLKPKQWCVECQVNPPRARGLCTSCYNKARELGELDEYPNQAYLNNPDANIRWGLQFDFELFEDILLQEKGMRMMDYKYINWLEKIAKDNGQL